jgi:LmbE family N-acetylglucosaminyl deacetylase
MMGEPINDHPDCFWRADVDEAASRLADLLRDEGADVLTVYDDHGGYGHPDHIQVHRVGVRAAALAGVGRVFQSTMNRDALRRLMEEAPPEVRASMASDELDDARRDVEQEEFGTPEAEITHAVDVRDHLAAKRASMEAHASQIAPDSFFLAMPPEVFAAVFGTEWYIELGVATDEGDAMAGDLFAGVAAASLRS